MTDQVKPNYALDNEAAAYEAFLATHPNYNVERINRLRSTEFNRLDRLNQVYLDYTGGGLYGASQLDSHMEMLKNGVYGNPHSSNPTSFASTEVDERARDFVFEFFNANPDEYIVIFTPNASGALKLVGESYPFTPAANYLLTFDNHNSVNGIREFAKGKGATVTYVPVLPPDLRLDKDLLLERLTIANPNSHNLFAYPAQSNFSGVQHDLSWIEVAQEHGWDVLLDAAAFAPTNRLDINAYKPDFVCLSFYKIFGYPTGLGALIARKDTARKLQRPWFAGGTIEVASVQANQHYFTDDESAFEDGTIDYLNLPAIETGLKFIQSVGIEQIHEHVAELIEWLLQAVVSLKHSNGQPVFRIYGPVDTAMRGGTIACNLYDPHEAIFDFRYIEHAANEHNISLRTGCFCNPGAGELALQISADAMRDTFAQNERMTFEQFVEAMTRQTDIQAAGAVRISVGIATTFADIYRFMNFAESFVDRIVDETTQAPASKH